MDGGYTCFYELTGTDGAIRVERAFTPPPDHQPRVWLNGRPLDPGPDDQFALCLRAFAARVRAGAGPDPADGLSLAQAAIADEIRLHLKEEPGGTQPSR
jgi:predicted dehydrogenase